MRYVLAAVLLTIAVPAVAQRDIKQKLNSDTRKPEQTGWLIRAERSGMIAPAVRLSSDRDYKPVLRPKVDSIASGRRFWDTPPMDRLRIELDIRPFTR